MAARETAQKIAELLQMLAPLTPTDADDAAIGLVVFNLESDVTWGYIERFLAALGVEQSRILGEKLKGVDVAGLPIWLTLLIQLLLKLLADKQAGAPAP